MNENVEDLKLPISSPDPPRDLLAPDEVPGPVEVVLDTDTYNEIDDQFALVYMLISPDRFRLLAVHAAPFHNDRSSGPEDGMEKSYEEIHRVLERMDWKAPLPIHRGATRFMPSLREAVVSSATEDLIKRALEPRSGRLHVIAIGAITNVASAILIEPRIVDRISVTWLGGHPLDWHHTNEFNMKGDPHASRLILDCGVPLTLVPCKNVAEHLRTTVGELRELIGQSGEIGRYLCDIVAGYHADPRGWSKVIWDIAPVAAYLHPKWVTTALEHSPNLTQLAPEVNLTWSFNPYRHLIRIAVEVDRDPIFRDFADKLARYTGASV